MKIRKWFLNIDKINFDSIRDNFNLVILSSSAKQ